MNKIVLLGRLVKDPELRYVEGGRKYIQNSQLLWQEILNLPQEKEKKILFQ
ncbi:phage-related single-strand DNA binding protein [Clostridium perfringens]|nr:phage-related single-strand DNA binding protein [Clostridium perfringens]